MKLYLCGDGNGNWFQGISPTGRVMMGQRFCDAKFFESSDQDDVYYVLKTHGLQLYRLGEDGPVACDTMDDAKAGSNAAGQGTTLYVYGDGLGNYYRGRDASGRVEDVDNLAEACFFSEMTKDLATDCIELGYNLYRIRCGEPVLDEEQLRPARRKDAGSIQSLNLGSAPVSTESILAALKQKLIGVLEEIDKVAPVQFLDWESEYVYNFLDVAEDPGDGRVYIRISGVYDNLPAHRASPLRNSRGDLLLPED